jgi:hypothetical protein
MDMRTRIGFPFLASVVTLLLLAITGGALADAQDIQWAPVGVRGFSQGWAWGFSLALDSDGNPWVAFRSEGRVMRFNGTAWQAVGDPFGWQAADISLALDVNDTPYVAFNSEDGGSDKCLAATVMRFDGTVWQAVGEPVSEAGCYTSMALDSTGQPWVAYKDEYRDEDNGRMGKATVKRFNGVAWVEAGNHAFSAGHVGPTRLVLDAQDKPYVAYTDYNSGWKVNVMTLDGETWHPVGSAAAISDGESYDVSLALDPQGMPWVAFRDRSDQSDKATVMSFDGAAWQAVGGARFTAGPTSYTSLALAADGTPYLAYVATVYDVAQNTQYKATVVRFDGTSWQPVGPAGFSGSSADDDGTALALDAHGRLYVAFRDGAADDKATVMRSQQTPSISCPASTAEATGPGGASVAILVTVDGDEADPLTTTWYVDDMGNAVATHNLPAGATQDSLTQPLALGSHAVRISVRDGLGDPVSCDTTVTVQDTTPPVIAPHANMTADATSASGVVVNYESPTWTDAVDVSGTATCLPASGSTFPIGTTTVTCTAKDAAGYTGSANFTVTVTNVTPPPSTITVTATPSTIWPPNKKMVPVKLVVTPADATAYIVSVTCNEAIAASDWKITGPLTVNLRADRNGNGTGRIYTIKVSYGSGSTATVQVKVPHDQGK